MTSSFRRLSFLLLAWNALLNPVDAMAASIGINFVADRAPEGTLTAADSAGVVPKAAWNNFVDINSSGTGISDTEAGIDSPNTGILTDDGGTPLPGVTVNWSANNSWNANNGSSNPDNKLMNGYLDTSGNVSLATVSVGNLPAAYTTGSGSTVIAYFGSDGNTRTGTVGLTGKDTFSFSTNSESGGGFPAAYVRTTDTGAGNPPANYAVWENVTLANFTLTLTRGSNNCGLHGIQIIGPEAPGGLAGIENSPATAILSTSATLHGTVTAIGSGAPTVTVFHGDNDGGSTPGDWDQFLTLPGNQTGAFSAPVSGLMPGTTYFYRSRATNGSGTSWAPASTSFRTAVLAPAVINLPATEIQTSSALLGAAVTSTGGEIPLMTIYWGSSDGSINPAAWENAALIGAQSGPGTATVSGLLPGRTYHFRAFASNEGGSSWAPSSAVFTTGSPTIPAVENRSADGLSGTSANLRGRVTDIGFDAPVVTIFYGSADGGTDAAVWSGSAGLGPRTGDFSFFLSGLEPLTPYYFRSRATNPAGTVWAPSTASFTTPASSSGVIVINEIHYDHEPKTERGEFVELYNSGDSPIDLSGWKLKGAGYTFPAGTGIAGKGFVVVAEDPATLLSVFGTSSLGPYGGKLSNDGDRIELEDASGKQADLVDYGIGFPWPTASRGGGASMELINGTLHNNLGSSWRASRAGTVVAQATYLPPGQVWRYRKGLSEASTPSAAWRFPAFVEDASWLSGRTGIGYGDGDDATLLNDMSGNYASVFLRREMEVTGVIPTQLLVRIYHDDGAIVWINGVEVARVNMALGDITYQGARASQPGDPPGSAVVDHEAAWTEVVVNGAQGFLVEGTNTFTIHGFNSTLNSSDFSIDCEIRTVPAGGAGGGTPTPGAANSVFAANAPPNIRQVSHSPEQPAAGQPVTVTARVTDPDGVAAVTLSYQLVNPGSYIRKTDPEYEIQWVDLPMTDGGANGDTVAGDSTWSAVIPGTLQTHRRLIRYRITVRDTAGLSVRTPYADDESPNFAYFCYNGVPDWTGSKRPGSLPAVNYPAAALDSVAVYHLVSRESDVIACQWTGPTDGEYRYLGTWVYDGKVYDHMRYRIRGQGSTRAVGKNKWKFNFNRAHPLEARDNYGRKYRVPWDKINGLPGTNPWWRNNASTDGTLFSESLGFRMYQLAGGTGSNTHFYHFRVIDAAAEAPAGDQYGGDFWGLYIAIEQPEAEFLDERGLPDGSIYNVHGGSGSSKRNQGATQTTGLSDLFAFQSRHGSGTTQAQWEATLDFEDYFAFNAMNLAINNSDLRPQENVNYYHNSATDRWHVLPWDLDLTFEDAPHLGRGDTPAWESIYHCLQYPAISIAYQNQVRQMLNLLLDNDQAARLVDEYAGFITKGGSNNLVEANQAVWDYHPRKNSKGIWYANFNPALLPSRSFGSLIQYTRDFLTVGGYGRTNLAAKQNDSAIPGKPVISYTGAAAFPADGLTFESSGFTDPQGGGTFGSMEWRLGEIHNPSVPGYLPGDRFVYEIETFYQSARQNVFQARFTYPPGQVRVGRTYRARVRHLDNTGRAGNWSDPVEFTASEPDLTPWRSNLMITELMYHPPDATPAETASGFQSSDFEFVELRNISGTVTLDLTELRFTKGINFDFSGAAVTSLVPGAYALVVRNRAAFESRYGAGLPVAGEYGPDNLDNAGENLKLSFGAGSGIHEITYDDQAPWPVAPDGTGFSLTLARPQDAPDHANPINWRASFKVGGTPGSPDEGGFSGDPEADLDGDGLTALEEYYFGQDDSMPGSPAPWTAEVVRVDGVDFPSMTWSGSNSGDVVAEMEVSDDLATWRRGESAVQQVSLTPDGESATRYVVRSLTPFPSSGRQYLRLRLEMR